MLENLRAAANWLLGPEIPMEKRPGHLLSRWIFLRALGLIYFSAFYSLLYQITGLLGPTGILPAGDYLQAVSGALHSERFWYAPTLLWFGSTDHALLALCWVGMIASLLLVLNFWPRGMLAVSFVCFLSFVSAAQDFSGYQSDGMLLEAGFICLFFAPPGFHPGLGRDNPPSRLSRFLLQWEWFRIYFESGLVKILSGDLSWRNFTAMDDYYQNGPLPTWIGWYVQHLPHWFHASAVFYTLAVELIIVPVLFLIPSFSLGGLRVDARRLRIACFFIITPFETSIILTANYTFLNYHVLLLGILLLDDSFLTWMIPPKILGLFGMQRAAPATASASQIPSAVPANESWRPRARKILTTLAMSIEGFFLFWVLYATSVPLASMLSRTLSFPEKPVILLEPFRIANRYGLFAVMTHARYEIEFQGTRDGNTWLTYPFRYKPQDVSKPPGIYAPYQPRFEWNLWFASLGSWRQNHFVVWTEERLLRSDPDVLSLFAADPFTGGAPPTEVRSVIWQYWFTDLATKRSTGAWWRRELLGPYAPALRREPDGRIVMLEAPLAEPPPP